MPPIPAKRTRRTVIIAAFIIAVLVFYFLLGSQVVSLTAPSAIEDKPIQLVNPLKNPVVEIKAIEKKILPTLNTAFPVNSSLPQSSAEAKVRTSTTTTSTTVIPSAFPTVAAPDSVYNNQTDNWAVALKSGVETIVNRVPIQMVTFLKNFKNVIMVGDGTADTGDYTMADVYSGLPYWQENGGTVASHRVRSLERRVQAGGDKTMPGWWVLFLHT